MQNKFYLFTLTTESAQAIPEVASYDSYEAALAALYGMFVAKMAYDTVLSVYCEIKNGSGTAVKVERWEREVTQ